MAVTKEEISYIGSIQKGIDSVTENTSEKTLSYVFGFIKDKYGKASISIGSAFKLYLKNSEMRYNKVKTLADLYEPRDLEGANGIYVDVCVEHQSKKISVATVDNLIQISNNIVIIGSGGIGKSMIMRHLFVNTQHRGEFIPVLAELRRISNYEDENALVNLVHASIESFDVDLDQAQFEYSLRTGKYLLLFDGLDEVKEEFRGKIGLLLQKLSEKYPKNKYIVSSRMEGVSFSELETFTLVNACPLEKEQAIQLIKKLGRKNEKIDEFARLLDVELYNKHIDFASNPLLLTMMYITFVDNNTIPEHLTDFYDSAYDALYKRHDANKEGLFKRDYKCKKLGEREFKDLFSYFCFQTYFKQKYEFSKEEICSYIAKGVSRLQLEHALDNPQNFFDDIKDIVCLIVEEGNKYKFAHRSFQMYFAAYYAAVQIADEQQKLFFEKELSKNYSLRKDFFSMLYRLEGERFNINILEKGVKSILKKIGNEKSESFALLKIACQTISVHTNQVFRGLNSAEHMEIPYERNIVCLFEELFPGRNFYDKEIGKKIIKILGKLGFSGDFIDMEIEKLLTIKPNDLKEELIKLVYQYYGIEELLYRIKKWNAERDKKREEIEQSQEREKMLLLL